MTRMDSHQSKVSAARPESISKRTTIPAFVAKQMDLSVGDVLDWKIDKIEGRWVAVITRM